MGRWRCILNNMGVITLINVQLLNGVIDTYLCAKAQRENSRVGNHLLSMWWLI